MDFISNQFYIRIISLDPQIEKAKITFDDLPNVANDSALIPNLYHGLKWTNIYYGQEPYFKRRHPNSGYMTAFRASGSSNVAVFLKEASISAKQPNEKYNLVSFSACAAWNDHLELTVTGYRNSMQLNTCTKRLLFGKPRFILLNWKDIDSVSFKSSGGIAHPDSGGSTGLHVIITQLTIIVLT